jgi:hypothetical protein
MEAPMDTDQAPDGDAPSEAFPIEVYDRIARILVMSRRRRDGPLV